MPSACRVSIIASMPSAGFSRSSAMRCCANSSSASARWRSALVEAMSRLVEADDRGGAWGHDGNTRGLVGIDPLEYGQILAHLLDEFRRFPAAGVAALDAVVPFLLRQQR